MGTKLAYLYRCCVACAYGFTLTGLHTEAQRRDSARWDMSRPTRLVPQRGSTRVCGTPLGFGLGGWRPVPRVRFATLGFGVKRRWRMHDGVGVCMTPLAYA